MRISALCTCVFCRKAKIAKLEKELEDVKTEFDCKSRMITRLLFRLRKIARSPMKMFSKTALLCRRSRFSNRRSRRSKKKPPKWISSCSMVFVFVSDMLNRVFFVCSCNDANIHVDAKFTHYLLSGQHTDGCKAVKKLASPPPPPSPPVAVNLEEIELVENEAGKTVIAIWWQSKRWHKDKKAFVCPCGKTRFSVTRAVDGKTITGISVRNNDKHDATCGANSNHKLKTAKKS